MKLAGEKEHSVRDVGTWRVLLVHCSKFTVFPKICWHLIRLPPITRSPPRTYPALFSASPNLFPHMPPLYPNLHGVIKSLWSSGKGCSLSMQEKKKKRTADTSPFFHSILFKSHTPLKVGLQLTKLLLLHKKYHLE